MTDHVLGIDSGLAHCGAATITEGQRVDTWVLDTDAIDTPDGEHPCLLEVDQRIQTVARWAFGRATTGTRLVVMEGPAFAAKIGQPHERAGLWWRIVRAFHAVDVPVAVLTPSTMKGYVTGSGNADKDRIRRAVHACYPRQGLDRIGEHEADAVGLAMAGCDWLGWDGPWLEGRRGTGWLAKAQWPARASVTA